MNTGTAANVHTALLAYKNMCVFKELHPIAHLDQSSAGFLIDKDTIIDEDV
jgi:hypothetical protein